MSDLAPDDYEALSEKELENLVVNDDRSWRPALEELFRRYSRLVGRRAEYWGIDQTQLNSRCFIVAGVHRASLKGQKFCSFLKNILDEKGSAWDSGSGFGSEVGRWLESIEGSKVFRWLGKELRLTPNDLDDVKHETYCKAVSSCAAESRFYSAKGSLSPWLKKIAKNAAFDLLRKKSRCPDPILHDVEDLHGPHEPSGEDRDLIRHLLGRLDPRDGEILCRRFCGEETPKEISSAFGLHLSNVYRSLNKSMQQLSDWAAEHEEG